MTLQGFFNMHFLLPAAYCHYLGPDTMSHRFSAKIDTLNFMWDCKTQNMNFS